MNDLKTFSFMYRRGSKSFFFEFKNRTNQSDHAIWQSVDATDHDNNVEVDTNHADGSAAPSITSVHRPVLAPSGGCTVAGDTNRLICHVNGRYRLPFTPV